MYYSYHFYKYFCKNISNIEFIPHIYKDQYQQLLKIRKIDCNLQNKHFII